MAQKSKKRTKNNKKSSGFAWACWLLVLILVLLVFLVKKDTIITNLKNTSFFDRVFGSTPEFVEKHEAKEKKSKYKDNKNEEKLEEEVITLNIPSKDSKKLTMDDLKNNQTSEPVTEKKVEKTEKSVAEKTEEKSDKSEFVEDKSVTESPKAADKTPEVKKEEKPAPVPEVRKTDLNLCFVLIDSEGRVSRREIKRSVNKSDSPLTEAINQLLLGPMPGNSAEKDCISVIPEGTKLLSARVSDGVAYLNFSEEFEFNKDATEGYIHQLEQIVYTATAFSTVKSVQFLIEGEKQDYLSEGIWIGSPLSRSSF